MELTRQFTAYSLIFLALAACSSLSSRKSSERTPASEAKSYGNQIRPFVSDGCSAFVGGLPLIDDNKWLHCCVQHDVLYWAGGTSSDREQADMGLRDCVSATGETGIAEIMYQAVRAVGDTSVPMTWRWGYGWVVGRGYAPLSKDELERVRIEKEKIPQDLSQVPIVHVNAIDRRLTITGDYCVDIAIAQIESSLGREFQIVQQNESIIQAGNEWMKTIEIQPSGCSSVFQFQFLLRTKDDCTFQMNELMARGRIRLQKATAPQTCTNYDH